MRNQLITGFVMTQLFFGFYAFAAKDFTTVDKLYCSTSSSYFSNSINVERVRYLCPKGYSGKDFRGCKKISFGYLQGCKLKKSSQVITCRGVAYFSAKKCVFKKH